MLRLALWVPLLLLAGCFSTKFYSTMNPLYQGAGIRYQRLLIQFVDPDPSISQFAEKTMRDQVALAFGKDVQCYLYSEIFYSGTTDPAEVKEELKVFERAKNIDAVVIGLTARKVDSQQVYSIDPTTHLGGTGTLEQRSAGYRLELFDLRTRRSIWYSIAKTDTKYPIVSFEEMMKGFIQDSVKQMKKDDLLGLDDRQPLTTPASDRSKSEI